jgi:hypothetical protein
MSAVGKADGTTARSLARSQRLHHVIALVVIAAACPGAMLGGALLNCAGGGFDSECAMEGITFSPFLLVGAGIVAGFLTRGWRGLAFVFAGVVVGMVAILVASFLAGNLVLIGPVEGIIATIWFGAPVALGYAIGRILARIVGRGLA